MARRKRRDGSRAPNGASTIYLGKDNYWHGRVMMGVRDDGKPDRRHVMRKTESEVITAVRELERQRDTGKVRKPGRSLTVAEWLDHWLNTIIANSTRPKTVARYRTDIDEYLIPGLGAHRINKLGPEHIERLYARLRDRKPPLAPSSIYHVHATLRTALNEAHRRRHIVENPTLIAKPPKLSEPEIVPLTVPEARRILDTAANQRNGARFALALAMGLRQGEAIGLKWDDLNVINGTLAIRRALQRQTWRHGCADAHKCGGQHHKTEPCPEQCKRHTRACPPPCAADCVEHARHCPHKREGGLVEVETKSRAGRRVVSLPRPLLDQLEDHRIAQQHERTAAGDLWQDSGRIFTQPNGKSLDPRRDYQDWQALLSAAGVRAARLHNARHTAATMLLVLKVPVRAVMDVMGWSESSMASRYMHVPDEFKQEIAGQVAGLLWTAPDESVHSADPETRTPLTDDQRAAVRLICSALPPYWQQRIAALLDEDESGGAAQPIPA